MNTLSDLYQAGLWRFLLFMTALAIATGGMSASATVGLISLGLLPFLVPPAVRATLAAPLAPGLLALAIAWTALSWTWSPYGRPDQVYKLVLLTPLYVLVPFAASRLTDERARALIAWTAIPLALTATYFLIEIAFGAPVSLYVKTEWQGHSDAADAVARAYIALGRGATGFLLAAPPIAIACWMYGGRPWRGLAIFLIAAGAIAGLGFGIEANFLAWLSAAGVALAAWRAPRMALSGLCLAAAALILTAPVYIAALLSLVPDSLAQALPLSWHMRLEIWAFALSQIADAPLFGSGLDATRVLGNETVSVRGVDMVRLPLHAHNVGLQIWLETGFVGAALFSATLAAAGLAVWRTSISPARAAALGAAGAVFLTTVMIGSGVWQEWLHGCLAAGCAAAFMIRR